METRKNRGKRGSAPLFIGLLRVGKGRGVDHGLAVILESPGLHELVIAGQGEGESDP
jgi:hypothetical protein